MPVFNGHLQQSLDLFLWHLEMDVEQLELQAHADKHTYATLLRSCGNARSLADGTRVHAQIARGGHDRDTFLGNLLVEMYGKCGSLDDACQVFEGIRQRNVFSWNMMVAAYAQNGYLQDARKLFEKMPQRDVVSWTTMFGAYARHGHLRDARFLFDEMPQRNIVSWNAMISAYAQNGHSTEAVHMFHIMQLEGMKPNSASFVILIDACAVSSSLAAQKQAKIIDKLIVQNGFLSDVTVGNALINLHSKCRSVEGARSIFDEMPERDVVSWTTMIAVYARNGHSKQALELFSLMDLEGLHPDRITFISLHEACADLEALAEGKFIHGIVVESSLESDVGVANSLVSMYGKCGSIASAKRMFDKMHYRDVITWTAMVTAYAQNGHSKEAIKLFRLMNLEGVQSDKVTYISVIDACTAASALYEGKLIHSNLAEDSMDVKVNNALMNMYAKCGSLEDAKDMFDKMPCCPDVVAWNAMITAYAQSGHGKQAIKLYQRMSIEGVKPDSVTFISTLNACSHAGFLKDGYSYFVSMSRDYEITPVLDHYVCMIDLLGRVGQIKDAEDLISNMPIEPNDIAWRTLLGACGINPDVARGTLAAGNILDKI